MVDHMTGRQMTGSQIKEASIKVASSLVELGYKKGDVILIFTTNCIEYAMLFLACGAIGAVVTTANPVYTAGELARQLHYSEACAVVTMPSMLPTVTEAMKSNKEVQENIREIFVVGEAEGCRPFSSLLDGHGSSFPDNVDLDPKNDVIVLPFSSGTTGLPKGVMLTHSNLIANLQQMCLGPMVFEADKDCLMGLLPFYHIYGMVVVQFGSIIQGAKLVVVPRFEQEMFLSAIQHHKISLMHLVPPVVLFLAKHGLVDNFDTSSLHTIMCGAAPLGEPVTKEVCDRLNVDIRQVYGLSESSPLTHCDSKPPKLGTIGRLVPSTIAKIICPETGQQVPYGEEGEMIVRGPQVMKGYLKNPEATNSTVKDGWLYTGDLAVADKEGYFVISDRLKELIKYKGYQVAPAELESLLCTHPAIQDAAVVGVGAGEAVGEIPKAFVVTKPNMSVKEEELLHYVAENVAPYKKLRGGIEFRGEIPKTASGKILRRLLKKQ